MGFVKLCVFQGTSQVAQSVKSLPANAGDTGDVSLIPEAGRSPGRGLLGEFSSIAWRIPWTEEPGRLQSLGRKESDMTEMT